jgi:hypothetical protein
MRVFAAGVLLSVTAFATPVYAHGDGNGGLNGTQCSTENTLDDWDYDNDGLRLAQLRFDPIAD